MMGPLPPSLVSWLTSSMLVLRPAAPASRSASWAMVGRREILLRALALVHHVQDFVHEAVQADEGGHLADAAGGGEQLGRGLFA